MKRNSSIITVIIIFLFLGAAFGPAIISGSSSNQSSSNQIEVLKSDHTGITLSLSLSEYEIIETLKEGSNYNSLSVSGYEYTNEIGVEFTPYRFLLTPKFFVRTNANPLSFPPLHLLNSHI